MVISITALWEIWRIELRYRRQCMRRADAMLYPERYPRLPAVEEHPYRHRHRCWLFLDELPAARADSREPSRFRDARLADKIAAAILSLEQAGESNLKGNE